MSTKLLYFGPYKRLSVFLLWLWGWAHARLLFWLPLAELQTGDVAVGPWARRCKARARPRLGRLAPLPLPEQLTEQQRTTQPIRQQSLLLLSCMHFID